MFQSESDFVYRSHQERCGSKIFTGKTLFFQATYNISGHFFIIILGQILKNEVLAKKPNKDGIKIKL